MGAFATHITRLGERSLLIHVESEPSESLLKWLLCIRALLIEQLEIEIVHTYNELLLKNCISVGTEVAVLIKRVEQLVQEPQDIAFHVQKVHRIPVCYELDFAPDLEVYAAQIKRSIPEIINLHTQRVYPIYFIGFLPGFPYLEGLDARLYADRKTEPSRAIVSGSVAVGGKQTGIYPQASPGGWHVIGRTPLSLFMKEQEKPTLFKPGEYLQFYAITATQFNDLRPQ